MPSNGPRPSGPKPEPSPPPPKPTPPVTEEYVKGGWPGRRTPCTGVLPLPPMLTLAELHERRNRTIREMEAADQRNRERRSRVLWMAVKVAVGPITGLIVGFIIGRFH